MSTSRPNRSRRFVIVLAAACIIAVYIGLSASRQMRQSDLDEQLFTAVQHGSTAEVASLLEQGANPDSFPKTTGDEFGLSAFVKNLQQGRFAFEIRHGMPMLGYVLNGFSKERPLTPLQRQQFKAQHILANSATCSDPLGKLRVLLEHHADSNITYVTSNPLTHAVQEDQADAVRLLLQYGANPDAQPGTGSNARTVATVLRRAHLLALFPPTSVPHKH